MTSRASAQLVVDAAGLVAFRAEHVQPAECAHLVAFGLALDFELGEQFAIATLCGLACVAIVARHLFERNRKSELVGEREWIVSFSQRVLTRETFGIATEEDVDTATRHVGGNGDRAESTCLGDDRCLTRVLLGVQHFVAHADLLQLARQQLALFHAHRADEDRLALGVLFLDVGDDGAELGLFGLVDLVGLVDAHARTIRRDGHDLQSVGVDEFCGFR